MWIFCVKDRYYSAAVPVVIVGTYCGRILFFFVRVTAEARNTFTCALPYVWPNWRCTGAQTIHHHVGVYVQ